MAKGLLDDFMGYSKRVRSEIGYVDEILGPKPIDSRASIWEVIKLWGWFLLPRRTDVHERRLEIEISRGRPLYTLFGVMVATIILDIAAAIAMFSPGGRSVLTNFLITSQVQNPIQLAAFSTSIFGGILVLYPLVFYMMNGLVYLFIKNFWKNDAIFNEQTHLMSLFSVAFAIFLFITAVISVIPLIPGIAANAQILLFLEIVQLAIMLFVLVYGLRLSFITLAGVHDLHLYQSCFSFSCSNILIFIILLVVSIILALTGESLAYWLRYFWDVIKTILANLIP